MKDIIAMAFITQQQTTCHLYRVKRLAISSKQYNEHHPSLPKEPVLCFDDPPPQAGDVVLLHRVVLKPTILIFHKQQQMFYRSNNHYLIVIVRALRKEVRAFFWGREEENNERVLVTLRSSGGYKHWGLYVRIGSGFILHTARSIQ